MKFKDKTKGGYSARCVVKRLADTYGWSVWAVDFLGKEEFHIMDQRGVTQSFLNFNTYESDIFNLVPDDNKVTEEQSDLQLENFEARLCKLKDEQSVQQDDINAINRELQDRLDPTIVDVNQLKDDVEDLEQRVDDDHTTLMDQVDQLSYLRKDFESLQTEVSEFRGEQNAMFTNLMDNNQDISDMKRELALMKKILEQLVDVNKMGTELKGGGNV
jgi:DNA repair exonuclease SbcCD ATPase subunit